MPVTALSCGLNLTLQQNVVYALSGAACNVTAGAIIQRSDLYAGPFADWSGSTSGVFNKSGGFVKCVTGNTSFLAKRQSMKKTSTSAYNNLIASHGASNYWKLDEVSGTTAIDSIGGKTGTISGGITLSQAGIGKSMLFNGTTGKIITTPITITPTTSFEWWHKTTFGGSITHWGIPLAGSNDRITFDSGPASLSIQVYHASIGQVSAPTVQAIPNLRDGNWHHIVAVFPGNTSMQVFIDGVSFVVSTAPLPQALHQALVNQTTPFQIGHHSDFVTWMNGNIDEVAIYPRALTPAEILSHYQSR